jgi:type I restriction enzyme S subunit
LLKAYIKSPIKGIKEKLFNKEIKFSGFTEKWRRYKVSDMLEFFPTNSLSWEHLEYNTGTIYNLHYGLIHQGAPNLIDIDHYTLPNIKGESVSNKFALCKDGDIVFADASEDVFDVAKAVEFINCGKKKIVCGLHTIHGRDKQDLTVIGFKGYAFSSTAFHHQIRRLAQGTKVFSISTKTLNECFIEIPSKEEQLKISNLLAKLTQKRRHQGELLLFLLKQKSYLLHNLFT